MPTHLNFLPAGFLILVAAVALAATSVASDEWVTYTLGTTSQYWGLFRYCVKPAGQSSACDDINDSNKSAELKAVTAMMCLSVIFGLTGLVEAGVHCAYLAYRKKPTVFVASSSAIFAALACVTSVVGVVLYHVEIYDDLDSSASITGLDYGYAFWLAISSSGTFVLACVFCILEAVVSMRMKTKAAAPPITKK